MHETTYPTTNMIFRTATLLFAASLGACTAATEVVYQGDDGGAADVRGRGDVGRTDDVSSDDGARSDVASDADRAGDTGEPDVGDTIDAAAATDAIADAGTWCVLPPSIDRRFPSIAVAGGYIYVEGRQLASPLMSTEGVTAALVGLGPDGLDRRLELSITRASERRLALFVPLDILAQLPGEAWVEVTTPCGTARSDDAMFFVETTGFGGKTEPSSGLLGNVYKLVDDAPNLPDFSSICTHPLVVASADFPCPFASLLVPTLDVPQRSFVDGFPGLRADVVEWFAIEFDGRLAVPTPGTWTFRLCSDDGSKLYVDSGSGRQLIIENDGQHSESCQSATVDLAVESVALRVEYFQGPRDRIALQLFVTQPGQSEQIVPAELIDLGLEW